MTDILTMGEVLIDLTQTGMDENDIPRFAAFPGGAPANVAVAASRLGADTGFIGKIGDDAFGRQLREALQQDGVDTSFLYVTKDIPTTLAIVSIAESGERSFAFYRQPGADTQLRTEEAIAFLQGDTNMLPKILHFGSLSLTSEPSRQAVLTAARGAKAKNIWISYDPNYREALWRSEEDAIQWMKEPLELVDILKVSEEELVMLTETGDPEKGSRILADHGITLVLITMGSEGVFYRLGDHSGSIPAEPVEVCDTNGAGDTFLGAVLARLTALDMNKTKTPRIPGEEELRGILAFANKAAAKTCSRAGAIPAMPTLEEMGLQK